MPLAQKLVNYEALDKSVKLFYANYVENTSQEDKEKTKTYIVNRFKIRMTYAKLIA